MAIKIDIDIELLEHNVGIPTREGKSALEDVRAAITDLLSYKDIVELKNNPKRKILYANKPINGGKSKFVIQSVSKFIEEYGEEFTSLPMVLIPYQNQRLIPLGFKATFNEKYKAILQPKSGYKTKKIISLPGFIEWDYPNEWLYDVWNLSNDYDYLVIMRGNKFAQLYYDEVHETNYNIVPKIEIENGTRTGGFGSTGI